MQGKFDYSGFQSSVVDFGEVVRWMNNRFKQVAQALQGPVWKDAGSAAGAVTLQLNAADLTYLVLTGNAAITLRATDVTKGTRVQLELAQNGAGGWVPTWVNATGTAGAVAAPAAGASKKTLYDCTFDGTQWVLAVLASNF